MPSLSVLARFRISALRPESGPRCFPLDHPGRRNEYPLHCWAELDNLPGYYAWDTAIPQTDVGRRV